MYPTDFKVTPCSVRGHSILSWAYPTLRKNEVFSIPARGLQMETELAILFASAPDMLATIKCNTKNLPIVKNTLLEILGRCTEKTEAELLATVLDLVKSIVEANIISESLAETGEYDG